MLRTNGRSVSGPSAANDYFPFTPIGWTRSLDAGVQGLVSPGAASPFTARLIIDSTCYLGINFSTLLQRRVTRAYLKPSSHRLPPSSHQNPYPTPTGGLQDGDRGRIPKARTNSDGAALINPPETRPRRRSQPCRLIPAQSRGEGPRLPRTRGRATGKPLQVCAC